MAIKVGVAVVVSVGIDVSVGEGVGVLVGVEVGVLVGRGASVEVGVLISVAVGIRVGVKDGEISLTSVVVGTGKGVQAAAAVTLPHKTNTRKIFSTIIDFSLEGIPTSCSSRILQQRGVSNASGISCRSFILLKARSKSNEFRKTYPSIFVSKHKFRGFKRSTWIIRISNPNRHNAFFISFIGGNILESSG